MEANKNNTQLWMGLVIEARFDTVKNNTEEEPGMLGPYHFCSLFDRMWSTGEGNGKPLQYSCLENLMNSMKRQKYRTLKHELPRSVGAQYATGDQWRNNSERMKGWSQSKYNTQLWMGLVIEARSDAVKSNIA